MLTEISCRANEPICIQAEFGQQFIAVAVFDEFVRDRKNTEAFGVESLAIGGFKHRTAEAAHEGVFFDRDHEARGGRFGDDGLIDRFDESSVYNADAQAFAAKLVRSGNSLRQHCAARENISVLAP